MTPAGALLAHFAALRETADGAVAAGPRPLILSPHPDDESLGCGGLIAAACAAGQPPLVVILTDGAASHPGSRSHPPPRLKRLRRAEARRAAAALGLAPARLRFLNFPDAAMPAAGPGFMAAAARLARLARAHRCGAVVGPWAHDPHCDHEAGAKLAQAVAERTGLPLRSYPVWGWLLPPDMLLDEPRRGGRRLAIAPHLPAKAAAIAAHASQYGGLITDAPEGFTLPPELLKIFARPFEVFIAP